MTEAANAEAGDGGTALTGPAADADGAKAGEAKAGEAKAGEAKAGEAKAGEAKAGEAVVPEKYADFKLPEGAEAKPEDLKEFHEIAKSLKLTQEGAQKLVDFEVKRVKGFAEQQVKAWGETVAGWLTSSKKDPEFGGANYAASIEIAKRSIATHGTPALAKLYDDLGLGNHPEVLRYHYRVGKTLTEAEIIKGRTGDGATKTLADRIFPSKTT